MLTLWRTLGSPARLRFFLALFLSALAGASGVVLLGLSGWFLTAAALAGSMGAGYVFNHLYPSAGVRLAAFSRVLTRYAEQLVGHDATLSLSARLRPALFASGAVCQRGMTAMPANELSTLIDDVDAAEAGFLRVFSPASAVIAGLCVAIGFALAADWQVGVVALVVSVGVAWLLPSSAARRSHSAASGLAEQTRTGREETARLIENAVELDVIGALPREAEMARESLELQLRSGDAVERPYRALGATTGFSGSILALAILWQAGAGAGLAIAVGAALALMSAFEAAGAMVSVFDALSKSRIAAAHLTARLEHSDAPWDAAPGSAQQISTVFPLIADQLIGQAAAGAPPIGPIDMAISPGTLVQLIGPSGSGKTTLAETLMRLHPPAGGNLRYAGISAGKVRIAAALERIALSPQFPAFLPGTLADQLRLAAPEATEADMRAALDVACASGFTPDDIAGSALTFDDVTMPYSGGELRRLGLARALLVSPQVLILDEPFAGLEADLARQLASNLAAWASGGERALILLGHKETRVPFPGMTTTVVHL
ncbi:MAG: ATP-binding cassette domain-containing protein [Hyphomonas sp.]|nr:ATP-binding cassette domain-containing protein [Hyphomonas sp.]MCB9962942.1 ATP-binding cassette domain-containing protein [Hyphomonas sp.]MCB9971295.1 ATP-binding cassette domain-containing protein [Hyphomonas sp.]